MYTITINYVYLITLENIPSVTQNPMLGDLKVPNKLC